MRVIRKRYLLIIFLLSFTVSFIFFNVSASAKTDKKTKIYIYPKRSSYPKLGIGDIFETSVKIEDVDNLYAYEFRLKYDPEVLEFVDISSSFLSGFKIKKTDESGVIRYASASMYPAEPKSGDGILATITFRIKGIGTSVLDLYNIKLADYDLNWIDYAVKDGYFSNENDEKEVELEWEENIASVELSTEVSSFESMIQTNVKFGLTYTESSSCTDNDIDEYGNPGSATCPYPEEDCDDYNPLTNPGNGEICDGKDNNCDGLMDIPGGCCPGDVDHKIEDNHYVIDTFDLAEIGKAFGSMEGEARWNKNCDLYGPVDNPDGKINVFDLALVGKNYWKTCGCVDVNVEFVDGPSLPYVDIYIVDPYQFFSTTNSTGHTIRCGFLNQGDYSIQAIYNGELFGSTSLTVDVNESGSATISGDCIHVIIHVQESVNNPIPEAYVKLWDKVGTLLDEGDADSFGNFKTTACLVDDINYEAKAWRPDGTPEWGVLKRFDVPDKPIITIEI